MIKFDEIIVAGKNKQINEIQNVESILAFLGEPEIFTPAYKSYPTMLVYGDLEFRFRNHGLEIMTITFEQNETQVPAPINIEQFQSISGRNFQVIEELLKQKQINWKKDEIMSDSDQEVYITENNVHLAFHEGILTKVGIVYR